MGDLLRHDLDWDYVRRMALRHGVMPLVYRHVNRHFPDAVPVPHMENFRQCFAHHMARTLFLTTELNSLVDQFERGGIQAIPYKGPALAVSAYEHWSLRQFVDLDILVSRQDVWRASEILVRQGYQPHFTFHSEHQQEAFLRLSYVQLFTREEGKCAVELHWGIAPRFFSFPLELETLRPRLETVTLFEKKVFVPGAEDLILMLCVHGAKDLWERLEWLSALAALIEKHPRLNWGRLWRAAQRSGGERMLLLGLELVQELLATRLPAGAQENIKRDEIVKSLGAKVRERLFQEPVARAGLRTQILFHLQARENFRDQLRYGARFALTTTPLDWALIHLPKSLAFLYYAWRPIRLLKKYMLADAGKARSMSWGAAPEGPTEFPPRKEE